MSRYTFATILALISTAALATSQEGKMMPAPKTSKSFEQLKQQLVGTWEAKMKMGDDEQTVKATYEVTSGGSAILERLFAGTDHEMVSVYHSDGTSGVSMTHYCMLGN